MKGKNREGQLAHAMKYVKHIEIKETTSKSIDEIFVGTRVNINAFLKWFPSLSLLSVLGMTFDSPDVQVDGFDIQKFKSNTLELLDYHVQGSGHSKRSSLEWQRLLINLDAKLRINPPTDAHGLKVLKDQKDKVEEFNAIFNSKDNLFNKIQEMNLLA